MQFERSTQPSPDKPMPAALAFSPCNITGFFHIHNSASDPLRAGSTGGAVALNQGVTTKVRVKRSSSTKVRAIFNNQPLPERSVSNYAATKFVELDGRPWNVRIDHRSPLPSGCGYGTSGAGALGIALALNEALGLSLETHEAGQIAHVSEIICRTGLGTVSSEFSGAFALRTRAGAPGIGEVDRVPISRSVRLITASFGPLSTSKVLGSDHLKKKVNTCSRNLIEEFDRRDSPTSFMNLSRRFADCLGLMSKRLANLVKELDSVGVKSSMVMLGESVFAMISDDEIPRVQKTIWRYRLTATIAAVAESGAHLL